MKLVSNFLYSLKCGIKGFFKNKTMSFISIISVSASLIILGIITSIVLNVNNFIQTTQYEVNEIRVSIQDGIDVNTLENIKENLKNISGIKHIEYKDKDTLLEEMKNSWGEDSYLLDGLENPLDDCYLVTLESSNHIENIAKKISSLNHIKDVEYHKDIINNFIEISNTIKKFGSVLIIFLMLICLVIISNTIKTKVYSKKEEIEIIKYVGGSNSFVRMPFIIEGFIIGIISSIISLTVCIYMYQYILENIKTSINFINNNIMISTPSISMYLIYILSITGITIGVLGSIISVKKHLKV